MTAAAAVAPPAVRRNSHPMAVGSGAPLSQGVVGRRGVNSGGLGDGEVPGPPLPWFVASDIGTYQPIAEHQRLAAIGDVGSPVAASTTCPDVEVEVTDEDPGPASRRAPRRAAGVLPLRT